MTKTLIPAIALLSGAYAQEWTAQFYQGTRCTGLRVGEASSFAINRECRAVENPGVTSSILYLVPESAQDAWTLSLHDDELCNDFFDAGSYELFPGSNAICIQTFGALRFGIEPGVIPFVKERSLAVSDHLSGSALSVRELGTMSVYDKRQLDRYGWAFSRIGAVGAFAIVALETCPTFASAGAPNALICGIGASISLAFGILAADEVRRSIQRPVGGSPVRRSGDLYADIFGLIDDVPYISRDLVDGGVQTTMSKLPQTSFRQTDDPILHVMLQFDKAATGEHWEASLDFDPRDNHTSISSGNTGNSLERRQSGNDFTAYYSYFDFDQSVTLPVSDVLAEQLGTELWNYGRSQNQGGFCANLASTNDLGAQFSINVGYYALISGLFTDQSPNCPF